ncbi:MAG: serine/threonine-protein phosphatase [Deltaproteobacteria bacterium]|nr:serine/threonine-protein phosphatase [Deltaproteobacteria bacterium]
MLQNRKEPENKRPTIARDLTVRLVRVLLIVFVLAATTNYIITLNRDNLALREKAEETANNLASVLVTPMWNINREELEKIIAIYRQSGIVSDIELTEIQETAQHKEISQTIRVPWQSNSHSSSLTLTRDIVRQDERDGPQLIGRIQIRFADRESRRKQIESILYSVLVFASISVSLFGATTRILQRFLRVPLDALSAELSHIAAGNYQYKMLPARQAEIAMIADKVQLMAKEIQSREEVLQQNQTKLETLNVAILDIFSCATTDALIRQTMVQAFRVTNCETVTFAFNAANGNGLSDRGLTSYIGMHGQVFEADAASLATHELVADERKVFAFPLKSRDRMIGTITVAFGTMADVMTVQLLRSLLSLATMGLIRLSEIREKAFIDTELQVAETMQQSMVFDYKSNPPQSVVVADHYEPVLRVGGDWFSVIESSDGRNVFVIMGDVTGHGLAQGLITTAMAGAMTLVEGLIKGQQAATFMTPADIITHLATVMRKLLGKSTLRMTCVAAQVNFEVGTLAICNAGHTFPLLLRQSDAGSTKAEPLSRLQQNMLGGEDRWDKTGQGYVNATYNIGKRDLIVFYTDGLTEARSKDGRGFYRPFQRQFGKISSVRSATALRDEILAQFRSHTSDVPAEDDICLMVIGRKSDSLEEVA